VKYKIGDLQVFITPDAEKMMEFPFDRAADYLKEDAAEDMVGFREVLKVLRGS